MTLLGKQRDRRLGQRRFGHHKHAVEVENHPTQPRDFQSGRFEARLPSARARSGPDPRQDLRRLQVGRKQRGKLRGGFLGHHLSACQQSFQLCGADVPAAADQSDLAAAEVVSHLEGRCQRGGAGGFDQGARLFDHDRRGSVDLVIGNKDEVVQEPAEDPLR